jgi:hypothetical protein
MSTEQLSPLISNGTAWRVLATAACPRSARNTAAGADRRRERGQLACVRCAKRARVVRAYASACARPRIVSREAFGRLTCARQGCKLTLCVRFEPTTVTMKQNGSAPACQLPASTGRYASHSGRPTADVASIGPRNAPKAVACVGTECPVRRLKQPNTSPISDRPEPRTRYGLVSDGLIRTN